MEVVFFICHIIFTPSFASRCFDQYRYTSPDNTFSSPYDKFNGSIEGSITEVPLFW